MFFSDGDVHEMKDILWTKGIDGYIEKINHLCYVKNYLPEKDVRYLYGTFMIYPLNTVSVSVLMPS